MAIGLGSGIVLWLLAAGALDAPTPAVSPPVATPAVIVPPAPVAPAATAAPSVTVLWSGYIQSDGVVYDQASQDQVDPSGATPLNQTRYFIRRARLHLDVDHDRMAGSLELDANTTNGPAAGVIDAEVTVRARRRDDETGRAWADASIGLMRIPWGYEISERDQDRFFLERSTVSRALFPGTFDLGLRARGGWRFLDAQVALMNGDPLGDHTFPVQDPNRAKDIVGRLGVHGTRGRFTFRAGASGLTGTGFHKGTPETKDVLVWRDQNEDGIVQLSEIQVIAGSAAMASSNFHRFALGGDARLGITLPRLGLLDLFVEGMWASNLDRAVAPADPVAAGRDLRERGLVIGLVQSLGKHIAAGARYDYYDPDADAAEQRALNVVPVNAAFTTWTATVAWRWNVLDRIVVEYQHVTNPLGRATSGAPDTLGGNSVALRGQLAW